MNRDVQQSVSFAIAMAVSICIGNVGPAYAADSPVPAAAAKT